MTKFKLLRQRESNAYKAITCEQFECAKIKKKSCQKKSKEDESGLVLYHIYPKLIEIPLLCLYSDFYHHK